MVNPGKNVSPIFIINLGLWITRILQNVAQSFHYSHNSGCCRRSVAPWITVLLQHTVFTIGVIHKFILVWYSAKQGTTFIHCALSGHKKNTDGRRVGWTISLASVVVATLKSENIFFYSESGVSNQNFTDGFLLEFDFFPGHCNRHLQRSALFALLCRTWHSCSNPVPLRYEQQTDLKLRCA